MQPYVKEGVALIGLMPQIRLRRYREVNVTCLGQTVTYVVTPEHQLKVKYPIEEVLCSGTIGLEVALDGKVVDLGQVSRDDIIVAAWGKLH